MHYTDIPAKEAIDLTINELFKNKRTNDINFEKCELTKLGYISVCNNPFRFMNVNHIQCDGVAMGSPLGPIPADIFMCNLEKKLNCFSRNKTQVCFRYEDDIFCIYSIRSKTLIMYSKKSTNGIKV